MHMVVVLLLARCELASPKSTRCGKKKIGVDSLLWVCGHFVSCSTYPQRGVDPYFPLNPRYIIPFVFLSTMPEIVDPGIKRRANGYVGEGAGGRLALKKKSVG